VITGGNYALCKFDIRLLAEWVISDQRADYWTRVSYRVAGRNQDRAMALCKSGYYYKAKRNGLRGALTTGAPANTGKPTGIDTFFDFRSSGTVSSGRGGGEH
jgi:hypothetical protein